MDVEALEKMTVAELREEAKKIPDAKGLSSMKKDDLVALIAGHSAGGNAPTGAASVSPADGTPGDKTQIKQRIRQLKEEKKQALAADDRERARACNRQIHHFKRVLRKMARTG